MACVFVPAVTVLLSANEVKESLDCMWSPQTGYLYTHPRGVGAEISGNIINIFFFRLKKKEKRISSANSAQLYFTDTKKKNSKTS